MKLNEQKTALTLGTFAGVMHAVWSLLVALGLAQTLLDWVYWLHFLQNPFKVRQFDIATAAMLVVIASIVGYIVGLVFATIWNYLHKK